MDDQVYEGLERILGPDGFVRGAKRRAVPAELSGTSKYEALLVDLPDFDSFRESFFVHGGRAHDACRRSAKDGVSSGVWSSLSRSSSGFDSKFGCLGPGHGYR